MRLIKTHNIIFFALFCLIANSAVDWKAVEAKVYQKIGQGHFTGCVLGVYTQNSTLLKKAYGNMIPRWGLYSQPVTVDSVFDVNYITQVIGINAGLMQLYDQQRLNVTDKVSRHLFDFDNNGKRYITVTNLMIHNSGLQATVPEPFGANATELLKKIDTLKTQYTTDSKFLYSELGFVVLGQVIAKLNNKTLDASLFQILVEAGMRETKFKPTLNPHLIVPSGYNSKGVIKGMPSNKIANFLGGIAGNAGLFSIVDNIGYYMQLLLNRGRMPLSTRIFTEEVVDLFTTKVDVAKYNNTRALGWDTVPLVDPPCGKKFSHKSFGFSDPLGSYIWADKQKNVTIVLLAAGGFPTASGLNHAKAQGQISDQIMTALGY